MGGEVPISPRNWGLTPIFCDFGGSLKTAMGLIPTLLSRLIFAKIAADFPAYPLRRACD